MTVAKRRHAAIKDGLLVLVCAMKDDSVQDVRKLAAKTAALRIFNDGEGKLNLDVRQAGGACLAVSQFTLAADTTGGNRPGFSSAAEPQRALELFNQFCEALRELGIEVQSGKFGADSQVALINDGPVTIWIDSSA